MVTRRTWEEALEEANKKLKNGKVISAISDLIDAARTLNDELEAKHRLEDDSEEVKVVHYTSLETIHALLTEPSTQYLRLYDSVHLTDPQEGRYVFNEIELGQKSGWLESPVSHAYIISFFPWEDDADGKTYDHLSHWRAYGDNGRGCSMVVSVPRRKLYEVNYCPKEKDDAARKLEKFVTISDEVWDGIINRKKGDVKYDDMLEMFATALKSRFLHKHPSYKHEHELRALVAATKQSTKKQSIKTEVRGRHIRHYVEDGAFRMDCLLTSECMITVGPAVDHQQDVAQSFRRILTRNQKTGPEVEVSKIPYRTI